MRKIMGTLAIAVLALTACGSPEAGPQTVQVEAAPASTTAAVTAAPIPAQEAAPETTAASQEVDLAYYVKGVRAMWPDTTATDEQLIAAGNLACEQLRDGTQNWEVSVVDGSEAGDPSNLAIASAAMSVICTDTMPTVG